MPLVVVHPAKIDTVDLIVTVSKAGYSFYRGQLIFWKEFEKELHLPSGGGVTLSAAHLAYARMNYWAEKKCKKNGMHGRLIASIIVGATKSAKFYVKLVLQPGQTLSGEFAAFQADLAVLMPDIQFGMLYQTARISRLDLAVDVKGPDRFELLPNRPHTRASFFYPEEDGTRGSLYFGTELSRTRLCLYDRNRKLASANQPVSLLPCTRIELRLRRLGCSLTDLASQLVNPFSSLTISGRALAQHSSAADWWKQFLNEADLHGVPAALHALPTKSLTAKARAMLAKAQVNWWLPGQLWNPQVLLAPLAPTNPATNNVFGAAG